MPVRSRRSSTCASERSTSGSTTANQCWVRSGTWTRWSSTPPATNWWPSSRRIVTWRRYGSRAKGSSGTWTRTSENGLPVRSQCAFSAAMRSHRNRAVHNRVSGSIGGAAGDDAAAAERRGGAGREEAGGAGREEAGGAGREEAGGDGGGGTASYHDPGCQRGSSAATAGVPPGSDHGAGDGVGDCGGGAHSPAGSGTAGLP